MSNRIIYTETDEAPALATYSLLPIIQKFTSAANIKVEVKDISLASRILALFSDTLDSSQKCENALEELGNLVKDEDANIIKLPNISASLPQLLEAIKELQSKGFSIPNFPISPSSAEEKEIRLRYDKVKGSAVNPVLREGNSDRRAHRAVKVFAQKHPHQMGAWDSKSKSHVASMQKGDFRANEKSVTLEKEDSIDIILETADGSRAILKEGLTLLKGEIIDGTFLSKKALLDFLRREIKAAKDQGILFSLHMKATMMKVSDPIIFGHAVKVFFQDVFDKYSKELDSVGANPNNGLESILKKLENLEDSKQKEITEAFEKAIANGPELAMVNSDLGINNLHVPSDVIIDASMPAMIRNSGQMWDKQGKSRDAIAVIPDSSYASIYEETINFCKEHGAFDPTTMGTVPNVGLMAQKAEEYGSHDKTFEIEKEGIVKVVNAAGAVLIEQKVEVGDIWRMCQVKDEPIKNWIQLAVNRAKATLWPTVFWLDKDRAHDAELIKKVELYLPNYISEGVEILILSPAEATKYTLKRLKEGLNTISVSGNVLRDYLTDLFPILELGTSAKMLSIVPLMNGGGLFETGAGGSAPKHVQQFLEENHLRWDSLGEFLALAVSLEHLSTHDHNPKAAILAKYLDTATEKLLTEGKSPSRRVKENDNRASHFYLALYWSEALSQQTEDKEMADHFKPLFERLKSNESTIVNDLIAVQGKPVDLGGYYFPNKEKVAEAMRPSKTFNTIMQ